MDSGTWPRTLAIVGPTASGKGTLGVTDADRLGLPVLVCDSVKVYRGLDVGSAKPDAETRARVPHHMLDLVAPDDPYSAGDYGRDARAILARSGGVFVGGTGFYLRAAAWTHTGERRDDLGVPIDDPRRRELEDRWHVAEEEEPGAVHRALVARDPKTAAGIHPNNVVRALRALWLCELEGGPVSAARLADPPTARGPLMIVVLDPGPDAVDRAIATRVEAMLRGGWLAEVEKLYRDGYDERHKAMRSVGYRQLLDVVQGNAGLQGAKEAITRATRQLARRQRTYFRHQLPADVTVPIQDPAAFPWSEVEAFLGVSRP